MMKIRLALRKIGDNFVGPTVSRKLASLLGLTQEPPKMPVLTPQQQYELELSERLRPEFRSLDLASVALQVLIDNFSPRTIVDIGSGEGRHADIMRVHGINVTTVDLGSSFYFEKRETNHGSTMIGDFMAMDFDQSYDAVWMSHVLEHQPNVGAFLEKAREILTDDGWLCVTVPPARNELVGGHLTLWTPGLLIYNLVLAGFDCSTAKVMKYGYNISVFCQKSKKPLPDLSYDIGDIELLKQYFPKGLEEGSDGLMTDMFWLPY